MRSALPVAVFLAAADVRAAEIVEIDVGSKPEHVHWGRLGEDPLLDLCVLGWNKVRVWEQSGSGFGAAPARELELPPEPGLVDVGDVAGSPADEIIYMGRRGVHARGFDGGAAPPGGSAAGGDGSPEARDSPEGFRRILSAAGIPVPLDTAWAGVLQDLNGDGRPELIIPVASGYEIHARRGDVFEKQVALEGEHEFGVDPGGPGILDPLRFEARIARLKLKDLNGDGLLDIVARRRDTTRFYLQGKDGFPAKPSYQLDLGLFRGEGGGSEPAKALGTPDVKVHEADIDADGVQDYLIGSGPFLRVYFGAKEGADFSRPRVMLKMSSELQGVGSFDVDGDQLLDLVAIKFDMPSIPRLVAAYFLSMTLDFEVLGYRNEGGRRFARRPTSRNTISLSVPPLKDVIGNFDALADRFIDAAVRRRRFAAGDADGDGREDAVFLDEDHTIRIFLSRGEDRRPGEVKLGRILFDAKKSEWELQELLDFVAGASHAAARSALGGRKPDEEVPLGPRYDARALEIEVRDLDGDRKGEIVVRAGEGKILVVRR
jgi:hypothetical protein